VSLSKKGDVQRGYHAAFPITWLRGEGTQSRDGLDPATVDQYAADMKEGDEFPAIDVFWDGSMAWIGDGHHRWWAAKRAKQKTMAVFVREGGQREAILFSVGANAGKLRSDNDKRKAVSLLLFDSEWTEWSDREIARRCHVGPTLVGEVRAELSARGQLPASSKRKGADGKVRDTAAIGAANKARGAAKRAAKTAGMITHDSAPAPAPKPRYVKDEAQDAPDDGEPVRDIGRDYDGDPELQGGDVPPSDAPAPGGELVEDGYAGNEAAPPDRYSAMAEVVEASTLAAEPPGKVVDCPQCGHIFEVQA